MDLSKQVKDIANNEFITEQTLLQILREAGYAVTLWQAEDVLGLAEEEDIPLKYDEAVEILQHIDSKHDASIGINWDVISTYIDIWRTDHDFPYKKGDRVIITAALIPENEKYKKRVGYIDHVINKNEYFIKFEYPEFKVVRFLRDEIEPYEFGWYYPI